MKEPPIISGEPPVIYENPKPARKKTVGNHPVAGWGLVLIGIVWLFLVPPIGIAVGIVFILLGRSITKQIVCSNCGFTITKHSKFCPACRSEIRSFDRGYILIGLVILIIAIAALSKTEVGMRLFQAVADSIYS